MQPDSSFGRAPQPGDIVIEATHDASGRYTLRLSGDAPQIDCATYDEAIARADCLAQSQHVDVWQIVDDGFFTLIIESRAAGSDGSEPSCTHPADSRGSTTSFVSPSDSVIDGLLQRIQGEFLEMPGMRLTEAQASRLWGLDLPTCSKLLRALTEARFLFRTRDGALMRIEHGSPLKASLPSRKGITAA